MQDDRGVCRELIAVGAGVVGHTGKHGSERAHGVDDVARAAGEAAGDRLPGHVRDAGGRTVYVQAHCPVAGDFRDGDFEVLCRWTNLNHALDHTRRCPRDHEREVRNVYVEHWLREGHRERDVGRGGRAGGSERDRFDDGHDAIDHDVAVGPEESCIADGWQT